MVQDLIQALQAQQNCKTSVQPLQLDGFPGNELVVATPDAVDLKKCCPRSGRSTRGHLRHRHQPMGDQAKAELAAIADSIRIG